MALLHTRLTRALGLRHPVLSAPMAFAGGGALAAAVSRAGGLGLIGGGYGDPTWLEEQFAAAAGERVGVGFITWSLRKSPSLLTDVLKHRPAAVMLSFGDPRPFVDEIRAADARLVCQCQDMGHVMDALEVGADVVVAQGAEAGGHGALRGTLSFVPEVADHIARHAPQTLLLAAGGIGDGRGLAASLMLGADGAMRERYDLGAVGARLAQFEREGRPVAIEGNYHGQWTLAGRLRQPLVELPDDGMAAWLAAHPDARGLISYREPAEIPPGLRVEVARRYRGAWLALVAAPSVKVAPP